MENLFLESKKIPDFSIISPIHSDSNFPNWKNTLEKDFDKTQPFQVESVDGYSMLLNKNSKSSLLEPCQNSEIVTIDSSDSIFSF